MAEMMINGDNLIRYCMEHRRESVPIERIKSEPRIEVERVRHGHWTMFHNPRFPAYEIMQCSECKWEIHKSKVRGRDHYYFCPECGARMDGVINAAN